MYRSSSPLVLLALLALVVPASGQEVVLPTPEEYTERAEAAEKAPLFQSHDVLRMTLRTDIEWLRDERNDSVEVEGTLTFIDGDGTEVVKPVDTRTRGNFRRNKRNCNFPPLRLDFPTRQMEGTAFEGQDKLKLVTPCNDGRDDYQNYVFDEYLAYRILNILTPYSFRVRLVEVTYEDIEDDYDTRTKYGFLIEDEEKMAERSRATFEEVTQFHPMRAQADYAVLVALFNYMIANTDWSPVYFHNVKLIRTEDARYLTVPYDFDFSGLVNARYATVDPSLQNRIRRVNQRLYRGFCRPELQRATAAPPLLEARAEIEAMINGFAALGYERFDADDAKDMLEFFEDFWEVLENDNDFKRRIIDDCRDLQTGRTP
ncbi:MAG: CotH kinase family protein [Gemmatimonadota bacterium]|nr:CotH kinase family protein [Gemmatimonadota bacterium]